MGLRRDERWARGRGCSERGVKSGVSTRAGDLPLLGGVGVPGVLGVGWGTLLPCLDSASLSAASVMIITPEIQHVNTLIISDLAVSLDGISAIRSASSSTISLI